MVGRPAPRSSASRDGASSAARGTGRRAPSQSQSPVLRSTRSTRSRSHDLHDGEDIPAHRATRSRRTRQGSVESTGSIASTNSADGTGRGNIKGKRKNIRAVATTAELPIVAEDQEPDEIEREAEYEKEAEMPNPLQSPGAQSNLSGTTALTTDSQFELRNLDSEMIIEALADLSNTSSELLLLLTPPTVSKVAIERSVKELQIPGSTLGKRLRWKENAFNSHKDAYGEPNTFITPAYILRKLFKDGNPTVPAFSPEPILQEANLAILLKQFLVAKPDSIATRQLLEPLDGTFPDLFLTNYEDDPEVGGSALVQETFKLALDMRTQLFISTLKTLDDPSYDPQLLLAQIFLTSPRQRDDSLSEFEDCFRNGECKPIAGIDVEVVGEKLSTEYTHMIRKRILGIRSAFNEDDQAIADRDYVDFDALNEEYSWTDFLSGLINWIILRLAEVRKRIDKQGGVQNIMQSLQIAVQSLDGNALPPVLPIVVDAARSSKSKKTLQAPAEIVSVSAGNSPLFPSSLPPSNQQQKAAPVRDSRAATTSSFLAPVTPRGKSTVPKERATAPAKITEETRRNQTNIDSEVGFRSMEGHEAATQRIRERTTVELAAEFYESENDKNKENRPFEDKGDMGPPKRRFIDRQENAERVSWTENEDEQPEHRPENPRKRSHQDYNENNIFVSDDEDKDDEDDDDDEEAYESDERTVDPSRRQRVPVVVNEAPQIQPSPKKARFSTEDEGIAERIQLYNARQRAAPDEALQDEALQASARAAAADEDEATTEEDEGPAPTYQEVKDTAKTAGRIQKAINTSGPRKRKPWSVHEENTLIHLIGRYGNQWSFILEKGQADFYESRDQGALKDKARNMKVDYLKAGSTLPLKFDKVALGAKEKLKVQSYGRNPYRLEGEEVGEESIGFDGPSSPSP